MRVEPLITHHYPLDEIEHAFAAVVLRQGMKVVILPNGDSDLRCRPANFGVVNGLQLELGIKSDPIEYRYSFPWLFKLLAEEDSPERPARLLL